MPAVRIYTEPLTRNIQEEVAKHMSDAILRLIPVPYVNVYFIHADASFLSSGRAPEEEALIEMEGPDVQPPVVAKICIAATKAFRENCGSEKCEATFVYHGNRPTHVGTEKGTMAG